MTKLFLTAALLGAISAVSALPAPVETDGDFPIIAAADDWAPPDNVTETELFKRDQLKRLPENAAATELRYQPYFDFDTDSCYNTAAIDPSGRLNPGLPNSGGNTEGGCREPGRLQNANVYSRRRCNNNRCGIIYAYYYEKDRPGHRHDWEHVFVATGPNDQLLGAAVSAHGKWIKKKKGEFYTSKDGKRPIVVYHKDGGSTHAHRFANGNDIKDYENYTNNSVRSALVGWLGWPKGLRDAVMRHDWGKATIELRDDRFANALRAAGAADYGLNPDGPDTQPH